MPRRKPRTPSRSKLTVREVADELGVTRQAVYQWIKRGDLQATRVDGRLVVTRKALRDMDRKLEAEAWRPRPKDGVLSEEEFLQALWDSDPD